MFVVCYCWVFAVGDDCYLSLVLVVFLCWLLLLFIVGYYCCLLFVIAVVGCWLLVVVVVAIVVVCPLLLFISCCWLSLFYGGGLSRGGMRRGREAGLGWCQA